MKLTHLNALRALEATLRLGSFSAASSELGITPAAVGQRIRALETYLGSALFDRSATGATPTAAARAVEAELGEGFALISDAMARLRPDIEPRTIRVTMPESFAENWFAFILSDFSRTYPVYELQVDASNRDHDLSLGAFDFAIRYGQQIGPDFEETRLFADSVQPVCSPDFARQHDLHAGRTDFRDVPLIHVLNRTGDPGWVGFDGWARAFGLDPDMFDHGVRFSKTGSGLQSAIAGQGLVMAGLVESFHALTAGRLVMPMGPAKRVETSYAYRLVRRREDAVTRSRRAFSEWIVDHAAKHERAVNRLLAPQPARNASNRLKSSDRIP